VAADPRPRCWVHKTANVLNKLPKSQHSKAKRALQGIWMAETKKDALAAFDAFVETWGIKYEGGRVPGSKIAMRCWPSTTSRPSIESIYARLMSLKAAFATVRHRTVRSKGCLSNKTALGMIFKLAETAEASWRRLDGHNQVAESHPGCKVRRGNRGCQIASSNRCRLTPSVTKLRR
jgi:putative transposase